MRPYFTTFVQTTLEQTHNQRITHDSLVGENAVEHPRREAQHPTFWLRIKTGIQNFLKNLGQFQLEAEQRAKKTYARVAEETLTDPQEGCANFDVVVTMTQRVPMIFPMTGLIMSNTADRQARILQATVRMPIERPLFK